LPASGELPSGNLVAGGNLVLHFTVVPFKSYGLPPKLFRASPLSSHAIEVLWQADVMTNYGFEIERAEGDGPFQKIAEWGDTGYVDENVESGKTYRYRARSMGYEDDVLKYSAYSEIATAQVLPPTLTLPVASLPSLAGARPDWLTEVNGEVYFTWSNGPSPTAWNSTDAVELWKTDGTAEGTVRIFDGPARGLINVNGTLFFSGYDSQTGYELWKTDGTEIGTVRVADIASGSTSSSPRPLGVLGSSLLFAVPTVSNGYEIWKTNGTEEGTARVSTTPVYLDPVPDSAFAARRLFTVAGSYAYFRGANADGTDAGTLWRTDGTNVGTVQIAGISNPAWLTNYGGDLLFAARSDSTNPKGMALWRLNSGASSATILGRTETFDGFGYLSGISVVNGVAYFSGETPRLGAQLWRSDGTVAGTFVLGRVNTFISGPIQYAITGVGGTAYFMDSYAGPHSPQNTLMRTDGTVAGTVEIRDYLGLPGNSPLFYLSAGGKFVYSDGTYLWKTDGTRAGTTRVDGIGIESEPWTSRYGFAGAPAVAVGDRVFYSTALGDDSRELRVASLTPPAAPSGVTAGGGGAPANVLAVAAAAGVTVSWRDNAGNEAGYVVDRFRTGAAIPEETFFSPPNATSLLDPSAASTNGFTYRVRSVQRGGLFRRRDNGAAADTVQGLAVLVRLVHPCDHPGRGLRPRRRGDRVPRHDRRQHRRRVSQRERRHQADLRHDQPVPPLRRRRGRVGGVHDRRAAGRQLRPGTAAEQHRSQREGARRARRGERDRRAGRAGHEQLQHVRQREEERHRDRAGDARAATRVRRRGIDRLGRRRGLAEALGDAGDAAAAAHGRHDDADQHDRRLRARRCVGHDELRQRRAADREAQQHDRQQARGVPEV
jgi:ELWxxDGT repeat protein